MRRYRKVDVAEVRRFLEPGPVVLVSSAWKGQRDIMTMGWHMVLEFTPSRLATMISSGNHSFGLIRRSGECVINVPTAALLDTVVGIGNSSGAQVDKFATYGLATAQASIVRAPLVTACHAHFECRLREDALVERYNFFIFEVVKAHVAPSPRHPRTLHYTGDGAFMVAGKVISRRAMFRPDMLP